MIAVAGQPFTAEQSELPMLYMLLVLGAIELLVVHLLVNLASPAAAWALSAVTLLGMVQIAAIVRRVKHRPTLLTGDGLVIRSAKGFEVALPWDRIAAVEPIGFGPAPSGDGVMRAALLAHSNVHVAAREAVTVKRLGRLLSATSITLRVDELGELVAAARHRLERL